VGISDDGIIEGYKPSQNDQKIFQTTVLTWNSLCVKEEIVRVGSRSIWLIVVKPLSVGVPLYPMATWNGDAYIRLGSSTQKAKNCLNVRMPI
jgi:hypothetical protein